MWELCIRVKTLCVKITLHMAEFQFPNTSEPGYQDTKCLSVYLCINIQQTEQDKEYFRLQLLNELQCHDFEFSFLIGKVLPFPALLTSGRPMTASAWKPVVIFTALHILTKRHFNLVLRSQWGWRDPSTMESFVCSKAQQEGIRTVKESLD